MKLKFNIIIDVVIIALLIMNYNMLTTLRYELDTLRYEVGQIRIPEVEPVPEPPIIPEEIPEVEDIIEYVPPREDVEAIARTMYGECRSVPSDMEKAAVAWCILNRYDTGKYGATILDVVSAPNQFVGYRSTNPLDKDLVDLAEDVMIRWHKEKNGESDVGRILPNDYIYFVGKDGRNWFSNRYRSRVYWDWSLENVYSS